MGQRDLDFELSGAGTRSIPISRPVVLHSDHDGDSKLHVIYRDEEYDNNACIKTLNMGQSDSWENRVLTENGLDRWEPTYDLELWRQKEILHLFIQKVGQGSGEKPVDRSATMIRVMEVDL